MQVIYFTLPATLLVFGIGTALAFLTGSWLGRYTAWRGPGFLSGSITLGGILLYTAFPPWLVFVLIYLLGNRFRRFGLSTLVRMRESTPDEAQTMWLMLAGLAAATLLVILVSQFMRRLSRRSLPVWLSLLLIALAWVASWFLMDIAGQVRPILQAAAFPILAYTLLSAGDFMLLTRTTMLDTMYEDYIWTAHAKGLRSSQVRDRHAGRNAILPVVSRLVIGLPFLLAGMVMIEETLKWPGIGSALFYAVGMQNLTLMMGMFLVIGLLSIIVRLILDVLIVLLDPRIRYGVSS
jgi:ABC-type dipeptide/oligopeptide/nickel transport system permease component